jgi:hypothetical protein
MHKSVENVAVPEPIGVKVKVAAKMGIGGQTQVYEFLKEERLECYHVGRAMFITTGSISRLLKKLKSARLQGGIISIVEG